MQGGSNFIVVPEGLAASTPGVAPRPSWVYRSVLERCHQLAMAGDHVYLAPANNFGQADAEQIAAHRYLESLGATYPIASFATPSLAYVDTRGNASLLREWLVAQDRWPLPRCILVVNEVHRRRAQLVFEQEGWRFDHYEGVPRGMGVPEPIVDRLWYYNHPLAHRMYEFAALWASKIRWI